MADSSLINSDVADDFEDETTSIEKFIKRAHAGISSVIYVMSKEIWSWTWLAICGIMIDFFQILSFLFYHRITWRWDNTVTAWLSTISNGVRVYNFGDGSVNSVHLAFYAIITIFVVALMDAIWVGWQLSENRVRFTFTVRLLRNISDLMIGPFYIPVLAVFVGQIPCAVDDPNCWTSASSTIHIVLVFLGSFFGLIFVALSLLLSATYYPRDPTGSHALAQPTSRASFALVSIKTIITTCFVLLSSYSSARLLLIGLLLLGTGSLAILFSWQMPYYRFDYNVARAASFWALTWASLCLLILEISSSSTSNQTSGTILFYLGTPMVILATVVGMRFRKTGISRRSLAEMRSPGEVELKARFVLETVTNARRLRGLGQGGAGATLSSAAVVSTGGSASAKSVSFSGASANKTPSKSGNRSLTNASSNDEDSQDARSDDGSVSVEEKAVSRSMQIRLEQLAQKQRFLEESRSLEEADEMFAYGVQRFGHSSTMHLLRAQHAFYYSESRGSALSHLARAESRSPQIDEQFSIYFLRKSAHDSFSGGDGNSDILQYIQMQKTMADAKKYDEQAVRHTLSFWDVLLSSHPDLNRMNDLVEMINMNMSSAYESFRRLMRLSGGNSIPVLRMYAGFLLDVANDPVLGHELLVRAEELEDQQSKDHSEGTQETANGVPSLDDRHAIVSISGELKKLGTIFQVNATALRLLGYNKYEMINRNVTVIVPAPFAQHHHSYLRRYMDLGDASVLNKSRPVFALHKTGYLIPINLYVREVSGESEHAFLGVLKEQVSQIQSAIVDPNYNVFGCTVVLGNLFNSSVEEMRAGSYHLSRWFPTFQQSLTDMKSPSGAEFKVLTEFGKEVSVRVWIVALPITGEAVDWIHLRVQIHNLSGFLSGGTKALSYSNSKSKLSPRSKSMSLRKPSSMSSLSRSKSTAQPSNDIRKPIMSQDYDNDSDIGAAVSDADDDEDNDPFESSKRVSVQTLEMTPMQAQTSKPTPAVEAAPTPGTFVDLPLSTKAMKKLKKQQSLGVSGSETSLPLLAQSSSTQSLNSNIDDGRLESSMISIKIGDSPDAAPKLKSALSPVVQPLQASDSKRALSPPPLPTTLSSLRLPVVKTSIVKQTKFLPTSPTSPISHPSDEEYEPNQDLDEQIDRKSAAKSGSSGSNSSSSSRNSIHSKFRTFARSRDSLNLSPTLRRLQIALMITIVLVLIASLLAYYLINSRITLYTQNLTDITLAGSRRTDPITFAMMVYQMMLTTIGFYDSSAVQTTKSLLLPLRLGFEQTDNDLYLNGEARAQVLADPALQRLYEQAVVPLVVLRDGVVQTQLKSMWDSTQELKYSITDVIVSDESALSYSNPSFFYIIRNADNAILNALNQSAFLYQVGSANSISTLGIWSISLMIAPLGCLVLVVFLLVRPTVRTIEDNKLAVLRLFLDIPLQLIQVFRSRISRRLAAIENSEDGAFGKKNSVSDVDGSQVQEEDEAAVIENALRQIRADHEPAAPFAQQVTATGGDDASHHAPTTKSGRTMRDREAERRARQAKADESEDGEHFFRRNITLIKISSYIFFAFVYFILTYEIFFAMQEESWASKPYQINWSSHQTLTMRSITYHLMVYLTQNYTATWYPRESAIEMPFLTFDRIQNEISFVYELIVALGMGSEYYGTLAPETIDQIGVNFVSACLPNLNQPADCPYFADRSLASGTYASLLSWSARAASLLSKIQKTVISATALSSSITNATLLQAAQLNMINATLNGPDMTLLMKHDLLYLYPITKFETTQFVQVASDSLTNVNTAKMFVLIFWLVFTVCFYLFYFSPLVYNLHVEHRRTTGMLLMISPDVMEQIPSVRSFVARISSNSNEL